MGRIACRTFVVAMVGAFLAATVTADAPSSLDKRKARVVQSTASQTQVEYSNGLADATARAAAITGVRVAPESPATVLVTVEGQPLYDWFTVDGGKRLVVDLFDTVNVVANEPVKLPAGSSIQQVRTSLFALAPQFVSRVVVQGSAPVAPQFRQDATQIEIVLDGNADLGEDTAAAVDLMLDGQARNIAIAEARFIEIEKRAIHGRHVELEEQMRQTVERAYNRISAQRTELASLPEEELGRLRTEAQELYKAEKATLRELHRRQEQEPGSESTEPVQMATGPSAATPAPAVEPESPAGPAYLFNEIAALPVTAAARLSATFDAAREQLAPVNDHLARLREKAADGFALVASAPIVVDDPAAPVMAATADAAVPEAEAPAETAADEAAAPVEEAQAVASEVADTAPASPEAPATPEAPVAAVTEPLQDAPSQADMVEGVRDFLQSVVKQQQAAVASEVVEAPTVEPAPAAPPIAAPAVAEAPVAQIEEEPAVEYVGDPLMQPVNIEFRDMDLADVVALLAQKANINVIASGEVVGQVNASMRHVPLLQALETILRVHGYGVVQEEGIFRLVPYEEAVAAKRVTRIVYLKNAQAEEVKLTLDAVVAQEQQTPGLGVTFAANPATNVVIVSGPEQRVNEFEKLVYELDIAEPTTPTVTEAIRINYADPKDVRTVVTGMLTETIGKVEEDVRGRHIVVTDLPAVVQQVREMVATIDIPVKQVAIEAMIIDAVMRDASQTGVNWLASAIRRTNRYGEVVGQLSQLQFDSNLGNIGTTDLDAGVLTLGVLSSEFSLQATIAAEVASRNAEILANPVVTTVENMPASIAIVQEFPYQEITQGLEGPPVASTSFKDIGVTLDVTPRVTHENDILIEVQTKQSSVSGLTETGVPIEEKREAQTSLRVQDGRTIFIGGLRNVTDRLEVSKVPLLGDIPVVNFMFRNTDTEKINTELLVFLTCSVLGEQLPELTPGQQHEYDKLENTPEVPDSQRALFRSVIKPQQMRDPFWKWRRPVEGSPVPFETAN